MGHVDAAHPVAQFPQPVDDPGAHADFVHVNLGRVAFADGGGHPSGELHGVHLPQHPDVLDAVAAPPHDDAAVGAEAGHVHGENNVISSAGRENGGGDARGYALTPTLSLREREFCGSLTAKR